MADLPARIEKRIERIDNGCWLWTGTIDRTGYGAIQWGSSMKGAHRVVYEVLVGPIPKGLQIDHLCRVRHCVNPDHMEPVTSRTNTMRGNGLAAINAAKTHCPQGHPYSGDNLVWYSGYRNCRACLRENGRKRRTQVREAP